MPDRWVAQPLLYSMSMNTKTIDLFLGYGCIGLLFTAMSVVLVRLI